MKKLLPITGLLFVSASTSLAQETYDLGEIYVSAGLQEININKTGSSVLVLQSDELKANVFDAVNLLDSQPGIAMSSSGGVGSQTGIRLRGLSQSYVAVRVDGVDVSDPTGTQNSYDFGGVIPFGFDQIEILKGSQSAIYGSEAIGGVLNFKTNTSNTLGKKTDTNLTVGSNNTLAANFKYTQIQDSGSYALSINNTSTDGYSAKSDNEEADPYSKTEIRFVVDQNISDQLTLGATALYSDEEIDYDGFDHETDHIDRSRAAGSVYASFETGSVTNKITRSFSNTDRYDLNGWNKSFIGNRDVWSYTGQAIVNGANITFGYENIAEEANIDGQIEDYKETALVSEIIYALGNSSDISLAARQTSSKNYGDDTTFRIASINRHQNELTSRIVLSSGFRAPSLYELFDSFYGNSTFIPETSLNAEIGLVKKFTEATNLSVTIFNNTVDNLIEFNNDTFIYEQNNGSTKTSGLELSSNLKVSDTVTVNADYTLTTSETGNVKAVRVPKHDLVLAIEKQFNDNFSGLASLRVARDIEDTVWPSNIQMPNYEIFDISLTYDINDKSSLYLQVQNLVDEKYETIKGYNTGGRQVFAGIRASF
ncbi:MAG: TonB-dependent receptor [Rhodobacteraceae bacterium]|nr:TonB-dependent receptor [Paracoccaceae bacterium]